MSTLPAANRESTSLAAAEFGIEIGTFMVLGDSVLPNLNSRTVNIDRGETKCH
jgi:hypothetical protein